jgi:hypothetical protein
MRRCARVAVRILCSAAVLSAAPVWAKSATPEEVSMGTLRRHFVAGRLRWSAFATTDQGLLGPVQD